jgi:hypothetical protein
VSITYLKVKIMVNPGDTRTALKMIGLALLMLVICKPSLCFTKSGTNLGDPQQKEPGMPPAKSPDVDARLRTLEETSRVQNQKLEDMKRTIKEQQEIIRRLVDNRLDEDTESPDLPRAKDIALQSQTGDVKKTDHSTPKNGLIRLSGDFRLSLDALLRKSSKLQDLPLPHAQNVRGRYRLRLNLDTDITRYLSFHGQVSTGPANNGLSLDQDFTSTVARHPFSINEAWIDFHPNRHIRLQGGRLQEVFADNSRFLFDDDIRFNGLNQSFTLTTNREADRGTNIELRAGQYWFSNPVVAVVSTGSSLARAGAEVGSIGRAAMLFHQGVLITQELGQSLSQRICLDLQVFREPNQIQLASTQDGVVFLVQPGLGLALAGPLTGVGNATTTPGGSIYTAAGFRILRLAYRITHHGFVWGNHHYPITLDLQVARNLGTTQPQRDGILVAFQMGKVVGRGDMSFLYMFGLKGANSIISQLTDDDLGTSTGVNIRTHHFKWELGIAKNISLQTRAFVQRQLHNSGDFPAFFVPLGSFAPRQYRFQQQIAFSF